jgi:hypothetical protein
MIVHDLNVFRISVLQVKAHSKLIIHADTVLPGTVAFQGFQPVAWWNAQIIHLACLLQLLQFLARHEFNVGETRYASPVEQGFSISTFERPDHRR